jgi:glycosyltransferase involved in cell wall biosynthesis
MSEEFQEAQSPREYRSVSKAKAAVEGEHVKRVLFISRVEPRAEGIGVEQRAWFHLCALSTMAELVVVVAMTKQRMRMTRPLDPPKVPCGSGLLVPVGERIWIKRRWIPGLRLAQEAFGFWSWGLKVDDDVLAKIRRQLAGQRFDAVVCFRIRSVPIWWGLARELRVRADKIVVDIDDIESKAMVREIARERQRNGFEMAYVIRLLAWKASRLEKWILMHVDCNLVCSEVDRRELQGRVPSARIEVAPNIVRRRDALPLRAEDGSLRMLLLGTMDYGPNADAAVYFCKEVFPSVRRLATKMPQVWIVGHRPAERVKNLANGSDIFVIGGVNVVEPYYRDTDVCVVPIRYGGGTRIKILEAMAMGRPVVSTTIGAEGICCSDGTDILLADDPISFAQACTSLGKNRSLAMSLVENAQATVRDKYTFVQRRQVWKRVLKG